MQSKRILKLNPYKPGEQPKDRNYIKLNANENPYPPAPEVMTAVSNAILQNPMLMALYPDPNSVELRKKIADLLNVSGGVLCRTEICDDKVNASEQDKIPFEVTPEMIFTGNGSDEVLSFIFYAFFDSDRPVIQPEHTYSFYPVYAGYYDIPLKKIPLNKDFTIDCQQMISSAVEAESSVIFANPNAPTGIAMTREQVRQMLLALPKNRVHVVDEAYVDFGGESCIPLLKEFPNLVIVRTFSKSLSFAGSRLGFVVANPDLIAALHCVKDSFNHFPVDTVTQIAGKMACECPSYYAKTAKAIVECREDFSGWLLERGWTVIPSSTNFILAKKEGFTGEEIYKRIKEQGILVRHFATPGVENFVRITIGNPEQMEELKKAIQTFDV